MEIYRAQKEVELWENPTELSGEEFALAQAEEQETLYGAVTIGDAWRFGRLEASQKAIAQDITLYRVPDDLEDLTRILIGILNYQ